MSSGDSDQLNDDWNLITRTIMPIINHPRFSHSRGWCTHHWHRIGRHQSDVFLSPEAGRVIWGIGPTMTLPTAPIGIWQRVNGAWVPAGSGAAMQGHWFMAR